MKKMNVSNNQAAFEYAIYLIASSYYNNIPECTANDKLGNLMIYYKETKAETQIMMEQIVIRFMDALVKKVPEGFFDEKVHVSFKPMGDGTNRICFLGEKAALFLNGTYVGKNTKIYSVIGTK